MISKNVSVVGKAQGVVVLQDGVIKVRRLVQEMASQNRASRVVKPPS